MDREAFVLENGDSFFAWTIDFDGWERHEETRPITFHEQDGTVRKGKITFTVESANIRFSASMGSLKEGQTGQLSWNDDRFFEVTISAVKQAQDRLEVSGRAVRQFDPRTEYPDE